MVLSIEPLIPSVWPPRTQMLYLVIIKKYKHMTKKEIKNTINKAVYEYAETLGYTMSDDNDGSYVTFTKPGYKSSDTDSIDYSRSHHETCVLNWASDEIKTDAEAIDKYAQAMKADVEWKLALENGDVE
jgi:hypothetical protein